MATTGTSQFSFFWAWHCARLWMRSLVSCGSKLQDSLKPIAWLDFIHMPRHFHKSLNSGCLSPRTWTFLRLLTLSLFFPYYLWLMKKHVKRCYVFRGERYYQFGQGDVSYSYLLRKVLTIRKWPKCDLFFGVTCNISSTLLKSGRSYYRSARGMLELAPIGSTSWQLTSELCVQRPCVGSLKVALVGVFIQWKLANAENQAVFSEPVVRHLSVYYWLGFRSQVAQRKVSENISNTNALLKQLRTENGRKRSTCPLLNRTMPEDKLDEGKRRHLTNIWGPTVVWG